jgi:hypothetical protein
MTIPLWGVTVAGEYALRRADSGPLGVPGGYDQVARRERLLAAHPGAEVWRDGVLWYGVLPLGGDGWRWALTCGRTDLGRALDALELLAARSAGCAAWEQAHPGWTAWYSAGRPWRPEPWRAWRPGLREPLKGASLDALELLAAAQGRVAS